MKIPFEIEIIFINQTTEVSRVKVLGGWLVNTLINATRNTVLTTKFISDPEWQWEV